MKIQNLFRTAAAATFIVFALSIQAQDENLVQTEDSRILTLRSLTWPNGRVLYGLVAATSVQCIRRRCKGDKVGIP